MATNGCPMSDTTEYIHDNVIAQLSPNIDDGIWTNNSSFAECYFRHHLSTAMHVIKQRKTPSLDFFEDIAADRCLSNRDDKDFITLWLKTRKRA